MKEPHSWQLDCIIPAAFGGVQRSFEVSQGHENLVSYNSANLIYLDLTSNMYSNTHS